MNEQELKDRTKGFALSIIRLVDDLPRDRVTDHMARQLLRSGTSVGANYRAACRGRSYAEMTAKLGVVEEEADECMYWMELLVDASRIEEQKIAATYREADQLLRIMVSSIKTLKNRGVREDVSPYLADGERL